MLIAYDWDLNKRTPFEVLEILLPHEQLIYLEEASDLATKNLSAFFQAEQKF